MSKIFFSKTDAFAVLDSLFNPAELKMIVDEHHGKAVFEFVSFVGKSHLCGKLRCEVRPDNALRFESLHCDTSDMMVPLNETEVASIAMSVGAGLMNPEFCRPKITQKGFELMVDDDWDAGLQNAIDWIKSNIMCRVDRMNSSVAMASDGSTPYFQVAVKLADFNFCDAILVLQPVEVRQSPKDPAFDIIGLRLPVSMPIDVAKEIGRSIGGENMSVSSRGDHLLIQ